jgi:hypothetical protein
MRKIIKKKESIYKFKMRVLYSSEENLFNQKEIFPDLVY